MSPKAKAHLCVPYPSSTPSRRPQAAQGPPVRYRIYERTRQISGTTATPQTHAELCGASAFCAGVGGTVPFSDNTVPRSSSFLRWSSACPPFSSSTVGCGRVLFFWTGVSGVESDGDSATGFGSLFGSSIRVISRTNEVPQYAAEYLFTYCVHDRIC